MNITNFAKKLAEKPVFKTRIKSDQVKLPEIAIGYFLAPFCAMFANAIFGAYLNRYYVDVLGWTKFGAFATLLPIRICDFRSSRKSDDRAVDRQYQKYTGKSKTLPDHCSTNADHSHYSYVYDTS